jgi:hypothetical protein
MNMRRFLTLNAALLFMSALALADTFSGSLLDNTCAQQQKGATCAPNASTTAFAIQTSDGKVLKLDSDGNRKAADALKQSNNGADRAKDPSAADTPVTATVQGTLNGDEIKVDSVQVQ